jgi:hypothetical protein
MSTYYFSVRYTGYAGTRYRSKRNLRFQLPPPHLPKNQESVCNLNCSTAYHNVTKSPRPLSHISLVLLVLQRYPGREGSQQWWNHAHRGAISLPLFIACWALE